MARLFFTPQAVRVNESGTPYAGAKANFYLTGTTTPTDTYQDSALSSAHANPVVADSGGQFAAIYLDPAITYKVVITDSSNNTLDTIDPVHVPIAADDILISDTGGYFTGTDVEAALGEVGANYLLKAGGTMTGDLTMSGADIKVADNVIERAEFKDCAIDHQAVLSSSNTCTIDYSAGQSVFHDLTENTTISLTNPPAAGRRGDLEILFRQDGGGGAYTVTWPASVLWPGGTAPVITTSNDALDVVHLYTIDGGSSWYGNFSQAYA